MNQLLSPPSSSLSTEEWKELNDLRKAISQSPASVVPWQQERFTFLFVKSIAGKGDRPLQ